MTAKRAPGTVEAKRHDAAMTAPHPRATERALRRTVLRIAGLADAFVLTTTVESALAALAERTSLAT